MNLFIDTTNSNFCLYLFDDNYKLLFDKNINGERRYSELLPKIYYQCLIDNKIAVNNLTTLYLTIGPGSYTGMRISLAFAKSLKLLNDKIIIKTIPSPQIYVAADFNGIHQIDARGGFFYSSKFNDGIMDSLKVTDIQDDSNKNLLINFNNLVAHIKNNHFKLQNNFFEFKLNYYKKLNFRKLK